MFYANGPVDGICDIQGCTWNAWAINYGYAVSDSIGTGGTLSTFNFAAWLYPGDRMLSLDWSIGSQPFGSDLGHGTASVTDQFLFTNGFGYDVYKITVTGLNVSVSQGSWLTFQNAVTNFGSPGYWDENAGPSQAMQNLSGAIPSESFNLSGGANACMPRQTENFKVIHDFSGGQDGASPSGVAIDRAGNLYGPTQSGGAGTVYKLAQAGSGWVLTNLYDFLGGDNGSAPQGVMIGRNGILYGAADGGIRNCGAGDYCGFIFGLRPSPNACRSVSCSWSENVLYPFAGSGDAWSGGGLVADQDGNLYGVSPSGGVQQQGAVFQLVPTIGGWIENVLYSFTGGSDGGGPTSILVGNDGNLYGTAATGGVNGGGVVFRLSLSGLLWLESVLYAFPVDYFGFPVNPHSLLQDATGNLFGEYAGSRLTEYGSELVGVVFMLTASNDGWLFTELQHGGDYLSSDVFDTLTIDPSGNLYGTGGGYSGCVPPVPQHGYIFQLTRTGDGWQYSMPVYWDNTYFHVSGGVALDARGNLYGTTSDCGIHNQGAVWQFTP